MNSEIIFLADIHIKLGQKNVPITWQRNRVLMLAHEIAKISTPVIVLGGDVLDVAKPSIQEVGLLYDFLKTLHNAGKYVVIIPGNHEMDTKKLDCFRHIDLMLKDLNVKVIREFTSYLGIDFIPYNIIHSNWHSPRSAIAITHVRGEIPPHVEPEIDLKKFSGYEKVFAGDLHSYTNSQANILYPGSPFSTSFHRSVSSGSNGYFIINTSTLEHKWVELNLPQLIRKTVSSPEEMIKTEFHHTIYELEGELEDLALVEDSELLDKKVTKNVSKPAALNMGGDIAEELAEFLVKVRDIKEAELPQYLTVFKEVLNAKNK